MPRLLSLLLPALMIGCDDRLLTPNEPGDGRLAFDDGSGDGPTLAELIADQDLGDFSIHCLADDTFVFEIRGFFQGGPFDGVYPQLFLGITESDDEWGTGVTMTTGEEIGFLTMVYEFADLHHLPEGSLLDTAIQLTSDADGVTATGWLASVDGTWDCEVYGRDQWSNDHFEWERVF